ncbi:MAG TPA: PadR family transcriptional regulator [Pseudonocardiaceae bacterium]|jgi:DNA-binding PadR family transcriptional regulator
MSDNPFNPGGQAWDNPLNDIRRAFRERVREGRAHSRHGHEGFGSHGEHGGRGGFGPGDFAQHAGPNFPPEGLPGFPRRPGFGGPGFGGPGFPPGFGPGFGPGGRGGRRGERRGGGHGRGRARRGNVRNAVLILLNEKPMHGYEIIKEIATRSGGWWRPSPGSVYPTLQLLADEGLIVTDHTDGTGKRLYSITDEGKAEAAKLDKTPPWEQAADDVDASDVALREALMSLMDAARQVANVAGPELKTKATKLITDTRRELYLILADADPYGSDEAAAESAEETDDPDES